MKVVVAERIDRAVVAKVAKNYLLSSREAAEAASFLLFFKLFLFVSNFSITYAERRLISVGCAVLVSSVDVL